MFFFIIFFIKVKYLVCYNDAFKAVTVDKKNCDCPSHWSLQNVFLSSLFRTRHRRDMEVLGQVFVKMKNKYRKENKEI